jgi:hypothetical protein
VSAEPGNDDRERTLTAVLEAIVGALLAVPGTLLLRAAGVASFVGVVLLSLGLFGVAHAVAVGLGLVSLKSRGGR